MAERFVNVDRATPMLLPPDLRDWVPEDDLVHFVIEATERLPLSRFQVNTRGTGSAQMPPHMMLGLLVYSYCNGIFSSRKIERATYRDIAVRYLTGDQHPDHDTIAKFRRENLGAISAAFVDILELARTLGLLRMGKVSTDGTHLKANASIDKNLTYTRATELREQLQVEIKELLAQAESADTSTSDEQALPEQIARREKLKSKMDQAIDELQKRAEQARQVRQEDYQSKQAAHQQRRGKGQRAGREPKPPGSVEDLAQQSCRQTNLTDPDARLMRKNRRSSYTQSYNAQASVDAEGSALIVGHHLSQSSGDAGQLVRAYAAIPEQAGCPKAILADAGYLNAEAIEKVQDQGCEVYCSAHREDAHRERRYDYRPPAKSQRRILKLTHPTLLAMREKLATQSGKLIYKLRAQTVEPVFGVIKSVMGFRAFQLRGLEKVSGEWGLVCLSYNLKRLHKLGQLQSV